MTPRQQAAAEARIRNLLKAQARALKPIDSKIAKLHAARVKMCDAIFKASERRIKPLLSRRSKTIDKYSRSIETIQRKLGYAG